MNRTIYPILAFIAILVNACNNPNKEAMDYPLLGAWEITYSKYVYPDTTFETTKFADPELKLLTKKHFAFGIQSGTDKIVGGGGEYTYDGNIYTEYVKYHTWSSFFAGKSVEFNSTLKGDLWTISGVFKNDTIQINATETWKRIPE
jgi:hypothetical protein